MTDPCTTWMALSDREALGELLSDDERAFMVRHGDRCPACASERAVWQELSAIVDRSASGSVMHVQAGPEVLPAFETEAQAGVRTKPERVLPWRAILASAAAVLMLGFSGELVRRSLLSAPSPSTSPPTVASTSTSAPVVATAAIGASVALGNTGQVEVDGKLAGEREPIRVGSSVYARRGTACLTVDPGVRACLAEGGLLRVTELSIERRRLSLQVGKVAAELDPQPPGTSFGVITRDGAAIAIGTAFSVEVPAGAGTSVTRVMHGTVLVRGVAGREHRVTAHRMVEMDGAPRELLAADEARELALIRAPRASTTPAVSSTSERAHGPARLLLSAREARARGDAHASIVAYRTLFARYDQRPEAHAARVPYGEILLADGDHRAALAAFDRYLARGGPLAEEASFGRVRALRALGATADERAALVSFLDTYPDSPLCDSLRVRAKTLGAR